MKRPLGAKSKFSSIQRQVAGPYGWAVSSTRLVRNNSHGALSPPELLDVRLIVFTGVRACTKRRIVRYPLGASLFWICPTSPQSCPVTSELTGQTSQQSCRMTNIDACFGSRVDGALARTFLRCCRLVGCGHVSGLFVRQVWPLALMLSADQVPIPHTHSKMR